jgi:hypothetical protein
MFENLKKKLLGKKAQPIEKPRSEKKKSAKEIATEKGEPYVAILGMEVDPQNLHAGSFELDWNDKFIANLIRAGYQMKADDKDSDIIDRWFQNICRNVVMETYEQEEAMNPNPLRFTQKRDIGGGRSEVS